ncbi:hypothetical protein DES53_112127 [Roseimicrobium gellanilyticum]|uniref:Uncharacterized protein n=1 Tax=Roseimicrobium gellanilyticum TaxID=748857 RepID=A0A366H8N1_9BACT|nr:hypothetical protein [Roseimicrobium gellanilyticum]RBP38129.1 hypothetical protein DES53_112127 [Roseimicrobium gellanilyticum]
MQVLRWKWKRETPGTEGEWKEISTADTTRTMSIHDYKLCYPSTTAFPTIT